MSRYIHIKTHNHAKGRLKLYCVHFSPCLKVHLHSCLSAFDECVYEPKSLCVSWQNKMGLNNYEPSFWKCPSFICACALLIFYYYFIRICWWTQHVFLINWAKALVWNTFGKWETHFQHELQKNPFRHEYKYVCVCVCVCVCV